MAVLVDEDVQVVLHLAVLVVEDVQVELYLAVLVVEDVHVELRVVALVVDVVEVEELQEAVLGCSIERSDSSELLGPFVLTFDLLVAPVPDLVGIVPGCSLVRLSR